jgi:hypothetical protein
MRFKDFITRQRIVIFVAGIVIFVGALSLAHDCGLATLPGELMVDLAASSVTVVFTALIIDYLGVLEEYGKTQKAANLAEDEIKAACFRLKFQMASFFGIKRQATGRNMIADLKEARSYLLVITKEVDSYLEEHRLDDVNTPVLLDRFPRYLDRLQHAQGEFEQTLLLYEYAIPYSLRERILSLRRELRVADNLLGFIDESLNEANISLIRVMSQSIYDLMTDMLSHESRTPNAQTIHEKKPA